MKTYLSLLIFIFSTFSFLAQTNATIPKQFLYKVTLAKKYHKDANWTDKDKQLVGEHFERLKKATDEGKVILAGRTDEAYDKTFGIVIFYAKDEAEAKEFMLNDPAVKAGIMKATLHPYSVALMKK